MEQSSVGHGRMTGYDKVSRPTIHPTTSYTELFIHPLQLSCPMYPVLPHPTTLSYILPRPTLDCSASGRIYNVNSSATRMDEQSSVGHGRMYDNLPPVFYHLCKCTTYHTSYYVLH